MDAAPRKGAESAADAERTTAHPPGLLSSPGHVSPSGHVGPSGDNVRVSVSGEGALGVGGDVTHAATGHGSRITDNRTYHDNRTYVMAPGPNGPSAETELTDEEAGAALDAYVRRIHEAYGRLDLEVLIPTTEGEHPQVRLREVFVPPLLRRDPPRLELPAELHRRLVESGELPESPDALGDLNWPSANDELGAPPGLDPRLWEEAREAYRDRPPVGVLETLALAESGRVALLGDPGAGKSTLARYLALALTSASLDGPLEPLRGLLPVVVELRRYAEADWRERSFEDFLAHVHQHEGHAPSPALLRRRLTGGRALVVFDGLDELFDPRVREDVARRITGFTARYPAVRTVVTSRVIGYRRHALDGADFVHYMIQPLDEERIGRFAAHWYAAVCPGDPAQAERLRLRLTEAIERSRPVRELAGNPLLLTILAIIARRQRLPRDRAGVYQHAVNVLIAHLDEDTKHLELSPDIRAIADLDDRDRREMLERLARRMQAGADGIAGNHVLGEDVERVFTEYLVETLQLGTAPAKKVARAMVRQFRERNFILSRYGSQVYGFVHRAFLEYLAATDIVRRFDARELTDEELLDGVFAHRAPDPAWHEVLLLIVGQVGERIAARAIDRLLELERGDGTGSAPPWTVASSTSVTALCAVTELRRTRQDESAPPAVLALRALAEVRRVGQLEAQSLATARVLVRYLETANYVSYRVRSDIEAALIHLGPGWAGAPLVRRYLHVSSPAPQSAMGYLLVGDATALRTMGTHAWSSRNRANALHTLCRQFPGEPGLFALIRDRALEDPGVEVRAWCVFELTGPWKDHPESMDLVRRIAAHDTDRSLRAIAFNGLLGQWADVPEVRRFALNQLDTDALLFLPGTALGRLRTRDPDDHEVHDLLLRHIVHGPSYVLRRYAFAQLMKVEGADADIRRLLWKHTTEPEGQLTRGEALDFLVQHWGDDPEVRAWTERLATRDDNVAVRGSALGSLVGRWGDPAVRRLVERQAADDPDAEVRASALDLLAGRWTEAAGVRELVQHQVLHDPAIRHAALQTLVTHWGEEPEVHRLVREQALHAPDPDDRAQALGTLATVWPNDPAVPEELRGAAIPDPEADAERDANGAEDREPDPAPLVGALRQRALHDPSDATRDVLLEHLTDARQPEVAIAAGRLLGALWPADPATVPALRARAEEAPDPSEARTALERVIRMAEAYAPLGDRLY
ncbi:NACHT domain-containing protein [Streptomyces sp. AJS327]|nr:NACHT domain-containing protein [Streptomyces sp. AJS327]